jgi:hypothetical protein
MSSIIEFFIAPDDDAAAAVADHGPGPGRDVVQYGNFDPVTTMGEWEDSFDIVPDDDPPAIAGDGLPLVLAVSASLQAALAAADEEQMEEAAARWTEQTDDDWAMTQEFASEMMNDIADLARTATRLGHRLYYWWG